mmetsp:Transcript_9326/g.22074  ORF Transcript_9326/g.22074 Transcript_9326/m.22074 type:complete len:252 (+) Transcript_9326:94-849(+)
MYNIIQGLQKTQDFNWDQNFEKLCIFREKFGHTNVPQRCVWDPCLGAWVGKQRSLFFKSKLPRNRQEMLEKIGFDWAPGKLFTFDVAWNKRFEELESFRELNGHCNVPCNFSENKELGFWVKNQRQFYKKKILDGNRISLLSQIGFEFGRRDIPEKKTWEERFEDLLLFQKQNGHLMVPQRSGTLGKWVQKQRDFSRKKLLKKYREELLNGVGFVWDPRKRTLDEFLERPPIGYYENPPRSFYFSSPGALE